MPQAYRAVTRKKKKRLKKETVTFLLQKCTERKGRQYRIKTRRDEKRRKIFRKCKEIKHFQANFGNLDRRKWEIICRGGSDVRYHAEPVSEDRSKCSALSVCAETRVAKDLPDIFAKRAGVVVNIWT